MGHFSGYLLSLFLKLFVEIIAYEILAVCPYARRSHTHTHTHSPIFTTILQHDNVLSRLWKAIRELMSILLYNENISFRLEEGKKDHLKCALILANSSVGR